MRFEKALKRALAGLVLFALACSVDPGEKYDNFLERADRTPPAIADASVTGAFVDLAGKDFLMNIALNPLGDLALRLRLLFTRFDVNADMTEAGVSGEFRFEDETNDDAPIASFDTVLDENGRMIVSTGVVFVPADRSPVMDTAVEAELNFVLFVLDEETLCGQIEDDASQVLQPITLSLKGTTFGAKLIGPNGELPMTILDVCPMEAADAGDAG